MSKKKITYEEAKQRFIDQGRDDIELLKEGFVEWGTKAKFYDKDFGIFWAIPNNVFRRKSTHPKKSNKKRALSNTLTIEEVKDRFKDRDDIELIEKEYINWTTEAKFYDKEYEDYFWALPDNVFKFKSCHPKRSYKKRGEAQSITFEEAKERFKDRDDIELIEFNGWIKKSKFFDKNINEYFFATPVNVYRQNSGALQGKGIKSSKKQRLPFDEAIKRFSDRDDIELVEYYNFTKKAKFFDKTINKYWWAVPKHVHKNKSSHPDRWKEKTIQTNMEKRGVENSMQCPLVKEKYKQTCLEKHGVEYYLQSKDAVEKRKKTNKERYNTEYPQKTKTVKEKISKSVKEDNIKYNRNEQRRKTLFERHGVTNGFALGRKTVKLSKGHLSLFEDIQKLFTNEILLKEKRVITSNGNVEYFVDIVFSQYNIVVEYNGDYWHANPKLYDENFYNKKMKKLAKDVWQYDQIRKINLENDGYKVLVVWEYDYKKNKEETLNNLKKEIETIIHSFSLSETNNNSLNQEKAL